MAEVMTIADMGETTQVAERLRTWQVKGRAAPGAKLNEQVFSEMSEHLHHKRDSVLALMFRAANDHTASAPDALPG